MTNAGAAYELSMMAIVNGVIDDLHGSLGLDDSEFFCECGRSACRERIKLTRTEYASLRDHHRPLLVADHAHRRPAVVARHALRVAPRALHRSGDALGR